MIATVSQSAADETQSEVFGPTTKARGLMPRGRRSFVAVEDVTVLPHPLRVRPLGSLLLAADGERNLRSEPGALGILGRLPDEAILSVLGFLDGGSLSCCASAL